MRNPTRQELMEFIDGALTLQRREEIEFLIRNSAVLQKEIALLKAIRKAVQTDLTTLPSKSFTAGVMKEILPAQQETAAYRLLKNSSNIFAMALVLSLIVIVLFSSPGSSAGTSNPISQSLDSFSTFYNSTAGYLTEWMKQHSLPLDAVSKTSSGKIIFTALIIFSLFVVLDEIFGKKYFTARIKH